MKKVEVSLVDVLRAVLQRWWVVVLCAVIGLGATYVIQKNQPQPVKKVVPYAEQLEKYEENLEEYREKSQKLKAAFENWNHSATLYRKIREEFLLYLKDSLLMRIDPYNAQRAYIQLRVVDDGLAANTQADLIPLLIEAVGNMPLKDALGDSYPGGIEESNLREIIQAKQVSASVMTIQCYEVEDTPVDAQAIVEGVFQYVAKYPLPFGGDVKVQKLDAGYVHVADAGLDIARYERARNFTRYHDDLQRWAGYDAQNKDDYERYVKEIKPVKPVQPAQADQAQTDQPPAIDKQKLTMGAFAGVAISIIFLVILFLYRLPVLQGKQVSRQLNLRHLGNVGRSNQQEDKERHRFICANLKRRDAERQNFLLLGNRVPLKELDALASELNSAGVDKGLTFMAGDDVFSTEKTIEMLNQYPDVVLVAKKNKSTIHSLNQEVERVEASLGSVVGYIFVNR